MPKCILIVFFLLRFVTNIFTQTSNLVGIQVEEKFGLLLAHSNKMYHLPKQFVHGTELGIVKIVSGKKLWHHLYGSPKIGISSYWCNLGNNEILGKVIGGYAFLEFPVIRKNRHLVSLRIGNGIGRVSKVFSANENPLNSAISSRYNALFQFSTNYNYSLNKIDLGVGFDFLHLSNAAMKSPNLGVNIPMIKLRVAYNFSQKLRNIELKKEFESTEKSIPKSRILGVMIGSQKQLYENPGVSYSIYGLTIAYQRIGSTLLGWEAGLDFSRNGSDIQLLYNRGIETNKIIKGGIYGAFVMQLDKFQMIAGMGAYIYDPYRLNGMLYHRVAVRYIIANHFVLNLGLKSQWFNADYAEFGLGFSL